MKPFFYYKGICELAKKLKGNENIYLGIRPYGFHSGNAATLVAYPILLCKEIEKNGKKARFKFYVFLNDWEQDSLDGPNPKIYPFNILPKFTTWQYMRDPINNSRFIVDYWEKIIIDNIQSIKYYYPSVKIISKRNSEMKNMPEMRKCILKTLKNPNILYTILKENTNKELLDSPIAYSSAVCPFCHAARGNTKIKYSPFKIIHKCSICGTETQGKYEDFNYWLYHKPLALPRIEAFNIDLCITGSDHYQEGDYVVREKLFKAYGLKRSQPITLYTQSVYGSDGNIMGKSKGNARLIDLDKIINLILTNKAKKKLIIPDRI